MTELIEDILSCGYNEPVNVEKREDILRYNCFFHYAKPLSMMLIFMFWFFTFHFILILFFLHSIF